MECVEMDEDFEGYLVTNLSNIMQEIETSEQPLLVKVADLPSKFQELKKSLEQPSTSAAVSYAPNPNRRTNLYELNKLLTERQTQMHSKNKKNHAIEYAHFNKFVKSLDDIKGKLRQANGENNHENSGGLETEAFRWSTRSVDETKVYGLHHKAMSLQRLLVPSKDDHTAFKAIGIVGMRGIGKTTLCQLIFNNKNVMAHFLPRIWVCLSKQPRHDPDCRKETVKRILACLGVEEEIIDLANQKYGLEGLIFVLRLQLMGKRYLIVLDDVWSTEHQYKNFCSSLSDDSKCSERLAYGLPKGFGGTVIGTSRAEEVAKGMVGGEENLHRLVRLSDPDSCWKIFKDWVGGDGERFSEDLESLKEKITDKCGGLPLAAKMMGQIVHQELLSKKQRVDHESSQEQGSTRN